MQFPVFRPLRPETAILMPIRLIAFLCRCLRRSGHEFQSASLEMEVLGHSAQSPRCTFASLCIRAMLKDQEPISQLLSEQEVETPQRCCKPHPKPSVPPRAPWRSPGELLRARRENCRPRPCESRRRGRRESFRSQTERTPRPTRGCRDRVVRGGCHPNPGREPAGHNIAMYEELDWLVGVLDGAGDPEHSCIIRGSRMFESKYLCPFDLSSSVPQREME
jgi:hypothetical protein